MIYLLLGDVFALEVVHFLALEISRARNLNVGHSFLGHNFILGPSEEASLLLIVFLFWYMALCASGML